MTLIVWHFQASAHVEKGLATIILNRMKLSCSEEAFNVYTHRLAFTNVRSNSHTCERVRLHVVCFVLFCVHLRIVQELGGHHDGGDKQTVDVERRDGDPWLLLDESIDVRVSHHEARGTAVGVLEDTLQVFLDANTRRSQAMEHCHLLRNHKKVLAILGHHLPFVASYHPIQQR